MNVCVFNGRMTKDAKVTTTGNGKQVASVAIAVNRRGSDKADFLNCVFWDKAAEIIEQYGAKGRELAIEAHATVRQYEKDGQKRTATDFVVDKFDFIGGKTKAENADTEEAPF